MMEDQISKRKYSFNPQPRMKLNKLLKTKRISIEE